MSYLVEAYINEELEELYLVDAYDADTAEELVLEYLTESHEIDTSVYPSYLKIMSVNWCMLDNPKEKIKLIYEN